MRTRRAKASGLQQRIELQGVLGSPPYRAWTRRSRLLPAIVSASEDDRIRIIPVVEDTTSSGATCVLGWFGRIDRAAADAMRFLYL